MLRSLRLSILLLGAIGVLACSILVVQGFWVQRQLNQSASDAFVAKDVVADILPPPMYLIELRLVLSQAVEGTLSQGDAQREVDRLVAEYNERLAHWRKNPPTGVDKQLLGPQNESAQAFITASQTQVMKPLGAGDPDGARAALPGVHKVFLAHLAMVKQTVVTGNKTAETSMATFVDTQSQSTRYAILATMTAWALVTIFYRVVLSSVRRPVEQCIAFAERIAAGKLAESLDVQRDDDIGRLQLALKHMQHSLLNVVSRVRDTSDSIYTASAEISQGNIDLSSRTEHAASNLQEAASSMEQLTGTVHQSAQAARQANQMSSEAAAATQRGEIVMKQVVDNMTQIDDASRKITEIITVIDGIAFQTNILALNAAVEAARAGDQGRGFAVVASEVRVLAQRSAQAAKEIKTLIHASSAKVESGTQLVKDAGLAMTAILGSVRSVSSIIGEITCATGEQSTGLGHLNEAVSRLDQLTQQNAALVEESAAAAANLKHQAQCLTQAVSAFELQKAH